MSRAKPQTPLLASARGALLLGASALALFLAGELLLLGHTDAGQVLLAKHFDLVPRPRVTQILSTAMKRALRLAGVPAESVHESFPTGGRAPVRWEIELPAGASLVQANYALATALSGRGGEVLSGREEKAPDDGPTRLTLIVGLPRYATHEVIVSRPAPPPVQEESASLALVLFGFDPDDPRAAAALDAPVPLAVAALQSSKQFDRLIRRARARQREVVLSLPLEPINYPRIDPGPGAVLVTMKPLAVTRLVRKQLEAAGPVVAVANHMGSLATQDTRTMRTIYEELRRQRLPFLHVDPAPGAVCRQLASDMGVSYQAAARVLDREMRTEDPRSLEKTWEDLLAFTRERGRAVVFVRATPGARVLLSHMGDPARHPGVTLVPLSTLVPRPPES
jgi:polysaccharide deacetylase 2 family uncharacterized protein YibQ